MATVQYNNESKGKNCVNCGSPAHEGYEIQYYQVDVHGKPTSTVRTGRAYSIPVLRTYSYS